MGSDRGKLALYYLTKISTKRWLNVGERTSEANSTLFFQVRKENLQEKKTGTLIFKETGAISDHQLKGTEKTSSYSSGNHRLYWVIATRRTWTGIQRGGILGRVLVHWEARG